ncbi:MAG: hypothetical protein Alis3KO_05710 [Aliiglaciecola sp.]
MLAQKEQILSSTVDVWQAFQSLSGIDTTESNPNGKHHYDEDIIEAVHNAFFPEQSGDLTSLFTKKPERVSAEQLIRFLLSQLEPFSLMTKDILELLSAAGAQRGQDNIKISFNFDRDSEPLDLLLSEFSEQIQTLSYNTAVIQERVWDYQALWEIFRIAGPHLADYGVHDAGGAHSNAYLRQWLKNYSENGVYDLVIPSRAKSGIQTLDDQLKPIFDVVNSILSAIMEYASDREKLRSIPREKEESDKKTTGFSFNELQHIESDYWAGATIDWIDRVLRAINEANQLSDDSKRNELLTDVYSGLEKVIPKANGEKFVKQLTRQLLEILNLPIWKKRHDVYAVWVGSQIWQALKNDWHFKFHLKDQTLNFAFSGSHLATLYKDDCNEVLAFWTELRTEHKDLPSGKRKNAIQPDYRIVAAPFENAGTSLLVVEVKQYKRASKSNFVDAVEDYSAACSDAAVILVNYGGVSESIRNALTDDAKRSSLMIGDVRPDKSKHTEIFTHQVSVLLDAAIQGQVQDALNCVFGFKRVELKWGQSPADLDLHLFRPYDTGICVDYNNREFEESIKLSEDVTNGYGPEIIELAGASGVWVVAVNIYSSDAGSFAGSDAKVTLENHPLSGKGNTEIRNSSSKNGKWWGVCAIDTKAHKIQVIDEVFQSKEAIALFVNKQA